MFWSESKMDAQALMGFLAAGPPNFSKLRKNLVLIPYMEEGYKLYWTIM